MKPFLKWAGGKRWLTRQLTETFPKQFNRYVEPFLGSGAVFFHLRPAVSILSDTNSELINTYSVIRRSPHLVMKRLVDLHDRHSRELFYEVRSSKPRSKLDAAVRFIYLNRTCWNGLYRVNLKNEFNVPIGTKTSVIFSDDDFGSVARYLANATLVVSDFEITIDGAKAGDLIYADPPYTVMHNLNGFLKYNQNIFRWEDQVRLRDCLARARTRGCHIVTTNADHESVRALYADFHDQRALHRESVLAGASASRRPTTELLVAHHG
jgi:DNA adenine methylase